jgi:hypothetical protein
VRPEGLGKLKIFIHLIGSQTRDFPVCSTRNKCIGALHNSENGTCLNSFADLVQLSLMPLGRLVPHLEAVLGSIPTPTQRSSGSLSGIMQTGREIGRTSPFSAEVEKLHL